MLIRNINETEMEDLAMDGVQNTKMGVMVGREDGAPNFAMRHVEVSAGGHSPKHSHDYEHEVYVVEGRGTIFLEGEDRPIRSGDVIYVPADELHQFKAASDEGLRFLCMIPMDRNCGEETPGS